jgi:hypothetical protein
MPVAFSEQQAIPKHRHGHGAEESSSGSELGDTACHSLKEADVHFWL